MKSKIIFPATILLLYICSFLGETLAKADGNKSKNNNIDPYLQSLIDDYIETEILPINKIPGLSLSILSTNGDIQYNTGYGYKNLEEQQTTDNRTLFGIGSVSKSFTATVVIKALSEKFPEYGSGVLDIPIQKLLPNQYNFTLGDRYRSESTTFRDLLSHNTCLSPEMLGIFVGAFETQEELVYRQRYTKEVCSFRTNFVYNNAVVAMAGEYIGLIMNVTFGELLNTLLRELEMNDTTFVTSDLNFSDIPLTKMYYYKNDQHHLFNPELLKTVSVAPGSGGILSTSNDMSKYLNFHLSYGKLGNKVIVPEEVMRWLHVPANLHRIENSLLDPANMIYAYGLGFQLGLKNKHPITYHDGQISTFISLFSLYPTLGIGIYSSSNGPGVMGNTHEVLHEKIFEILTGENVTRLEKKRHNKIRNQDIFNSEVPQSLESKKVRENISKIDEIVGQYGNGYAGEFNITLKNGTGVNETGIYLNYGKLGTGFLRETGDPNIYYLELDSDLIQEVYAAGQDSFDAQIDFNVPDKAILYAFGSSVEFVKGLTLDNLPVVPYDPNSCGPVY